MATRTITQIHDDVDGSQAAETVAFGLDGVQYEIDVSERNAERLRKALARYTAAARRIGGRAKGTAKVDREQSAAIRAWARAHGLDVNERGRIPIGIVEQYHASGR
jgi:hypothetical protein